MKLLEFLEALLFHCIKVGRFFGVDVRIHWSFWILPATVGFYMLSTGVLNAAIWVGLLLLFFVCVVLHEYGHILAARACGVSTRDIILTPIGGIARMEQMPDDPVDEIVIALAGPAVNVVISIGLVVALVVGYANPLDHPPNPLRIGSAAEVLWSLLFANIGMILLNMLPAFPSDGGRVLRGFLSMFIHRLPATRVAVYLGTLVAIALAVFGLARGQPQFPLIAALFIGIGQMELWMLRRQTEMERRPRVVSSPLHFEEAGQFVPPEPQFSGYAWDHRERMWVEWRDGTAVRLCRARRP